MDDSAALFRIRVVVVSTRAAVRSLIPGDEGQLGEVLGRARGLLDEIEADMDPALHDGVAKGLAEAREEIARFERRE